MGYRVLRCGSLLLSLLVSLQLQAAVYKWTDDNGQVHFSDRPVHQAAEELNIHTAPSRGSADQGMPQDRKERRQRLLDVYERERADKREAAEKSKQAREERKRKCLDARAQYDEYSSAGAIYNYLESGEREYLDKAQRQQYIDRLKTEVQRYCN